MAFDLNNFLNENKKFLMGTFVGAAFFAVAYAVINSYVWDDMRASARDVATHVKNSKQEYYSQKNLDQARAEETRLNDTIKNLAERLTFVPRGEFQLKDGGASPQNQYLDIASRYRERRLDDARSRGIDITDSCGVPDRAPTQAEDIRRTLRALDLADRVVDCAIQAGVRAMDKITVSAEPPAAQSGETLVRDEVRVEFEMEASSKALSAFLEFTQAFNPPLTIEEYNSDARDPSSAGRVGRGESLVHFTIRFAALDVAPVKE